MWPVKCFLDNATQDKKELFIKLVKEGYIGLDGLFSNELTGLCRPEELIQCFEYSNNLERNYGVKIESAMISDIPGYSWGIVSSAAQNGIKYFSSGPNSFDRIGNILTTWGDKPFYWKSNSGADKLLVWVAGKGYAWFHGWRLSDGDPSLLLKYLSELADSKYPYDMVQLRYTIGGDNGYPDPNLSEFVKEWNEKYESPKLKITTTAEMFKDLDNKYKEVIPTFSGDFTPYWEDGASSSARETAVNRATSERLVQSEILQTLLSKNNYSFDEFDKAWENVLLFTEHTWGAFNSIEAPESDFVKGQWELKKVYGDKADSLSRNLLSKTIMSSETKKIISDFEIFNTVSWSRTDVVKIPKDWNIAGETVLGVEGKVAPSQRLTTGELVFIAKNIPPLSSAKFKFSNKKTTIKNNCELNGNVFSNNLFKISFDNKTGAITELFKKTDNINLVDTKKEYALNQYVWTERYAKNPKTSANPIIKLKENGAVYSSVLVSSDAPGCNSFSQEIVLFNDIEKIDLINNFDKKNDYNKENVRLAFPFNVENQTVRMDVAWSVVTPEKDQLPGANKNYYTIQRWIDVSNENYGVTMAVVDVPLIELGKMTGESYYVGDEQHWMKEAISSPLIFSWVMNNSWHTNYKASQPGLMTARYSLLPHSKFDYLAAYKFGVENSQPLIPVPSDENKKVLKPLFTINENIVVTSIKPSRDNKYLMVRLFNPTNETIKTSLNKRDGFKKCYLSRADELIIKEISGNLDFVPFEVKTLKVEIE